MKQRRDIQVPSNESIDNEVAFINDLVGEMVIQNPDVSKRNIRVYGGNRRIKVIGHLIEFEFPSYNRDVVTLYSEPDVPIDIIDWIENSMGEMWGVSRNTSSSNEDGTEGTNGGSRGNKSTTTSGMEKSKEREFKDMTNTNGTITYVEGDEVCFEPPLTKDEASYDQFTDIDREVGHVRCGDCIHYIDGGGCHLVRGEIDEDGVCEHSAVLSITMGDDGSTRSILLSESLTTKASDFKRYIRDFKKTIKNRLGVDI